MPCGTKDLATKNNCTEQAKTGSRIGVTSKEEKKNCTKQKESGLDKSATLKLVEKNACNKTKETGARGLKNKLLREKIRGTNDTWACKEIPGKEIDYEDRFLIGKKCAQDETSIKKYKSSN